jgi:hypothetical protein
MLPLPILENMRLKVDLLSYDSAKVFDILVYVRTSQDIRPILFTTPPCVGTFGANNYIIPLPKGELLGISILGVTAGIRSNGCWARCELVYAHSTVPQNIVILGSGVFDRGNPWVYPGISKQGANHEIGCQVEWNVAAGALASQTYTVPNNCYVRPVNFHFVITTGAVAGDRVLYISFRNSSGVTFSRWLPSKYITASGTWEVIACSGDATFPAPAWVRLQGKDTILREGQLIFVDPFNAKVGDTWDEFLFKIDHFPFLA